LYGNYEDPPKALKALAKVELQFPNDPLVLTMIGDFNYRAEDWDTAYKYFARAIKAAGNRSLILISAYAQGADALAKSIGCAEGRRRAAALVEEGLARLPGNAVLLEKLREFETKAPE
jgi:uncharacterized protein HemY